MRIMSRKWMPMVAIALSAVMSTVSVDAQIAGLSNVNEAPGLFNIIPPAYTCNHEPMIVVSDFSESDYATEVTLLNSSLEEDRTVVVENTPYHVRRYYEECNLTDYGHYVIFGGKYGNGFKCSMDGRYYLPFTLEEANEYIEQHESYYTLYSRNDASETYKYYSKYVSIVYDGETYWYPENYCCWDAKYNGVRIDDKLYCRSGWWEPWELSFVRYNFFKLDKEGYLWNKDEDWGVSKFPGEWVQSEQNELTDDLRYPTNAKLDVYGDKEIPSYTGLIYTQTLFNDDEELEYVEFKYRTERVRIQNTWTEYWQYDRLIRESGQTEDVLIADGIAIRNTGNETIATAEIPEGYSISTSDPVLILDYGSHKYIVLSINKNKKPYYQLFEIDGLTSSIDAVSTPMQAKVFPTMVAKGEDVTVDVPETFGPTTVIVTSVSGQTVHVEKMSAGGGRTVIQTGMLARGMHVVTLSEDGAGGHESVKIIVK